MCAWVVVGKLEKPSWVLMTAFSSSIATTAVTLSCLFRTINGLLIGGVDIPHAKISSVTQSLESFKFPNTWPYTPRDLAPFDSSNDQFFYLLPKFVHHAGEESRRALSEYYACVLPKSPTSAVLDLCSSFTSHYPSQWKGERCVVIGLNPLELMMNPSKTEWKVQNLNADPNLPFSDNEFDIITNSLSVDYLTKPMEVFKEMHRVLKPGWQFFPLLAACT